jgi:broad specificity phosphatase PhoE
MSTTSKKTTELYLIRHGQTEWNSLHKAQGCEHDISLNDNGRSQAKKTGQYLANYRLGSGPFDLIISSGMDRAHETAKIIAEAVGYNKPILIMEEFKEKCHGELGGKTDEELAADPKFDKFRELIKLIENEPDPIKQREIYYSNNKVFNEQYGTELYKDLRKRIKSGINALYNLSEKKIIVVSHGGTIQQALQIFANTDDYIMGDFKHGTNCHISYIKLHQVLKQNKIKRRARIVKLLNTQHLKHQDQNLSTEVKNI